MVETVPWLKVNFVIHLAALGTSRTVNVRVIGINESAVYTTKNMIAAWSGFESLATQGRLPSNPGYGAQGQDDVGQQ